ncbi:MAG: enoyl-CoA hydratase/isomerase family protein [Acidimicrobiales bacterium]
MSGPETLEIERAGGVVTVTLNRPEKLNAMNDAMFAELGQVFAEVADNDDDRVLVITGRGRGFCSGADLSARAEAALAAAAGGSGAPGTGTASGPAGRSDAAGPPGATVTAAAGAGAANGTRPRHSLDQMRWIGDAALRLYRLAKPTIAKVNGVAAGAGCNLALGCDLVVASTEARFSQIFARRGLSLDFGGSWLLPRIVGLHKAKELALLADITPAEEALRIGLVNRVVPADQLDAVVDDWATRLAAGPPLALSMTKTMLDNSFAVSMDQALEDEARCQAVNLVTEDVAEAGLAFLEKRTPTFRGR